MLRPREVVRPKTTKLLNLNPSDYVLDIACGKRRFCCCV